MENNRINWKYPFGCRFAYFCENNGSFGSAKEPTEIKEGDEYYGSKVVGWKDLETGIEGKYKWSN